ncbi:DnaD domain-containing protein [Intestinibacter sp.]|uniref:DnaD domain-containing protein n=1 Tax=Intestinibacter sp. TaxID=1965304 RepID=UPI002A754896|nr:DnaD domain protein [Intestinibacter sp.]MDY2737065.1 DnaD domain protein [Intestinibacter sp.]
MAKFKVNKTKDYTIMSNYHLKEKNMSLKAKGLLSVMLSLPDNWDYSISGLVAISLENETSIKSALSELKKLGYLEVIKLMPNESETGRIDYIYNIYEKPKQEGKKQEVENLPLEILEVENQGQLNTNNKYNNINIINTKKQNIDYINNNSSSSIEKCDTIYDFLEQNFGRTLNSIEIEMIREWNDNELTRYAIKQAVLNGKYNVKYINTILVNYRNNSITTVQQAQEEEKKFKSKKEIKKSRTSAMDETIKEIYNGTIKLQ